MKTVWIYNQNDINWDELSQLYKIAPLGEKSAKDLEIAFTNSQYKCFIFIDSKLVGAGRALADGVDCSYICDVAVHPQFQGLGFGKKIIQKLIDFSKSHKKIILYTFLGKEEFYYKLGFKKMTTAMAIFKDDKYASNLGLISEN
jgi:ribosomal protein S18 acetylase RimI-like enzyme